MYPFHIIDPITRKVVSYLKNTKGGELEMCQLMEEFMETYFKERIEETKKG